MPEYSPPPNQRADGLTLKLEDVALRAKDNLLYGPLNLALKPGQGALIVVDDLGPMRRLMKCCLGFLNPDEGRVNWWRGNAGLNPCEVNWNSLTIYRRIGYVDRQSQILTSLPLLDNLVLFHEYAGLPNPVERSRRILDDVGLAGDEMVMGGELSEPLRRRALYALALCGRPRLMLMERPSQFLDRDFVLIWDIILRRAREQDLAFIVFDRQQTTYNQSDFDYITSLTPGLPSNG